MYKRVVKVIAKKILDDRAGLDNYKNSEELAKYLNGSLSINKNAANFKAKLIHSDRQNSNIYKDLETLTWFLAS